MDLNTFILSICNTNTFCIFIGSLEMSHTVNLYQLKFDLLLVNILFLSSAILVNVPQQ